MEWCKLLGNEFVVDIDDNRNQIPAISAVQVSGVNNIVCVILVYTGGIVIGSFLDLAAADTLNYVCIGINVQDLGVVSDLVLTGNVTEGYGVAVKCSNLADGSTCNNIQVVDVIIFNLNKGALHNSTMNLAGLNLDGLVLSASPYGVRSVLLVVFLGLAQFLNNVAVDRIVRSARNIASNLQSRNVQHIRSRKPCRRTQRR